MKILIAGDTHANMEQIEYLDDTASINGCSKVVQVGDFGWGFPEMKYGGTWALSLPRGNRINGVCPTGHEFNDAVITFLSDPRGAEWYFLDGNHDNHEDLRRLTSTYGWERPIQVHPDADLFYCPRGSTWTWDGVRFLAFGGAYSVDQDHRIIGVDWWPDEQPSFTDVSRAQWAADEAQVDVMFSHDAPNGTIISRTYSDGGRHESASREVRNAVTAVANVADPYFLIHGHHHHRYTESLHSGPRTAANTVVMGLDCDGTMEASWVIYDTEEGCVIS